MASNQDDVKPPLPKTDNLSKKAIAAKLGVTASTIVRWVKTHGFPQPYTFGGRTFFSVMEVDDWQERQKQQRGFNGTAPSSKQS